MLSSLIDSTTLQQRYDILRVVEKKYLALQSAIISNGGVVCEKYPEAFFPEDYGIEREAIQELESMAIRICKSCPVQKLCVDYAMTAREPYGIWGGTLPSDR
jgi:hypothetical protein